MAPSLPPRLTAALAQVGVRFPELRLLVLFGSRAAGNARPDSDWDFAYQGGAELDALALAAYLSDTLQVDDVDLVDLDRAGGLIRFHVARDGVQLFERLSGNFDRFWFEAVTFWCDAEPVLRRGYEAILARLPS